MLEAGSNLLRICLAHVPYVIRASALIVLPCPCVRCLTPKNSADIPPEQTSSSDVSALYSGGDRIESGPGHVFLAEVPRGFPQSRRSDSWIEL